MTWSFKTKEKQASRKQHGNRGDRESEEHRRDGGEHSTGAQGPGPVPHLCRVSLASLPAQDSVEALGGHPCGPKWPRREQQARKRKGVHVQELARSLNDAGEIK